MKVALATAISLLFLLGSVQAITLQDIYQKLLEREKGYGIRFTDMFIRPIAVVDGEFVWPRSYSRPGALMFDENGSAFNVRKDFPKLHELISRTPIGRNHEYLKSIS